MKTLSISLTKSFSFTFPKLSKIFTYLVIINLSAILFLLIVAIGNFIYLNKLLHFKESLQQDFNQLSKDLDSLVQQLKELETESKIKEFVTTQGLIKVIPSQIKYLKISPENLVQNQ